MNFLPKRILLATDGSECAESAGLVAVDLANRSGAELHVVYAFEFVSPREFAGVALRMRSPSEGVKHAQSVLDEQVGRIEEMGGGVADTLLLTGSPVDQILCAAEETDAGLVVVGRRGLSGVKRLLMGSVSEGVVHHARCPVLVVCGDGDVWPPARVVIADDSSEEAMRTGELAAGIGGLFGAEDVLVQVYPQMLLSTPGEGTLESRTADHALRGVGSELRDRAEALAPILGHSTDVKLLVDEAAEGVDGVALTLLGRPGEQMSFPSSASGAGARGNPAHAGGERLHEAREGRRGSGPGLPQRLLWFGERGKRGLTGRVCAVE